MKYLQTWNNPETNNNERHATIIHLVLVDMLECKKEFLPYGHETIRTTEGSHISDLFSGKVHLVFTHYFLLPERLPYLSIVFKMKGSK